MPICGTPVRRGFSGCRRTRAGRSAGRRRTVETAIRFYESGGYWTIGAGGKTQNPTDLLNSERMKNLVAGFREDYDLVIIDTPPTGLVIDPVIVSNFSDKIVMIVRWGLPPANWSRRPSSGFPGTAR